MDNACVKGVRIRSYSGRHFQQYSIQFECGKMRIRITLNTDIFCAVNDVYPQTNLRHRFLIRSSACSLQDA